MRSDRQTALRARALPCPPQFHGERSRPPLRACGRIAPIRDEVAPTPPAPARAPRVPYSGPPQPRCRVEPLANIRSLFAGASVKPSSCEVECSPTPPSDLRDIDLQLVFRPRRAEALLP